MAERKRRPGPGEERRARRDPAQHVPGGDRPGGAEDPAAGYFYRPNTNQIRQEPLPASHHDERWQEAVERNEEHAHGAYRHDFPGRRGRAVRDLTPGDAAPGPLEPSSQITSGDSEQGRPVRARRVTRVAPARPDGEVNPGR